jgi:hypothetical protein
VPSRASTRLPSETWDIINPVMPYTSDACITPDTDPSILDTIETWEERDLAVLAQISDENAVDRSFLLTPMPVNMLVKDPADQDAYKLIPIDKGSIAPKIQLTYVDPATINRIFVEIDHVETIINAKINHDRPTSDGQAFHCTLELCRAMSDLGNLIPLRRLLAIESLF